MEERKDLLRKATSFALYYGTQNPQALSKYDIVIIEPSAYSNESIKAIKALKANGSLVLAYISLLEIHPEMRTFKLLKDEDFLSIEGRILKNYQYGTYIADLRSERWRSIFEHKVGALLLQLDYDGIFIDTAGDIEYLDIPEGVKSELIGKIKEYLGRIKKSFPDHITVINNGTEELIYHVDGLIDGICWENPQVIYKANKNFAQETANRLAEICENSAIKLLVITEGDQKYFKHELRTIEYLLNKVNHIYYNAKNGYTSF